MDIRTELKSSRGGIEVYLSGKDAAKIDAARLQSFLQSRMACMGKNHCRPNDNPAVKVKCLTNLIEHKYVKAAAEGSRTGRGKDSKGGVIHLKGSAARLKEFATPKRVQRLVQNFAACRSKNRCSPKQGLVERWNCTSTLAQHILQR